MDLYCTRPGCARPGNSFADLDAATTLKTVPQKFCMSCGMPLILDGRYVTLKLLGRGGFGAAFLARDRRTPGLRLCVVKQFQPSGTLTPNQLQVAHDLFEREAEALDRLGNAHPQIPDLFASFNLMVPGTQPGAQQELFYLVQEYIDGLTLEEELAQNGPLSEAAVREILLEVLKILKFVHDQGAIHRDIKPSNIMRNQAGIIYLLDFGAVKQVTTAGSPTKSTGIYSQGFAPPEQVAGSQVYACTDFYALAVTCIMLLTGKAHDELYDSYKNSWQWRQYAAVSDPFARVLDRMLLAAPNQRFQTVSEVLEALQPSAGQPGQRKARSPSAGSVVPSPVPAPTSLPNPSPGAALPPQSSQAQSSQAQSSQAQSSPAPAPISRSARASSIAPFSTLELLGNAAFSGIESALLAIALFSLPIPAPASAVLWLLLAGGLIFAQSQRLIEKVDLPITAGITLAIVLGLAFGLKWVQLRPEGILILAGLAGLLAIAATALFKLIYKVLSGLL
jgi:serine/threonine protein kinase